MFSREPAVLGQFAIDCRELMFVQYMPILMPRIPHVKVPDSLGCFKPLIDAVMAYVEPDHYVYLTAKRLFVGPNCLGNRPGWHTDGFGTDDINFIWSDAMPTEFCVQEFNLSDDHDLSLVQMESQVRSWRENIKTYPVGSLLMLDSSMVHRAAPVVSEGYRTFAKISVSRERYNLAGNAHNYLFDYDWLMVERQAQRNHPVGVAQ